MKALDRALSALVMAALAVGPSQVLANSTSGNFTFTVNLTAACEFSGLTNFAAFDYTSFGTAPTVPQKDFTVRCTDDLLYSLSLTSTNLTSSGGGTYTSTGPVTNIVHAITVNTNTSGTLAALLPATQVTGTGIAQTYALTTAVNVANATCATAGGSCQDITTHTIVATF